MLERYFFRRVKMWSYPLTRFIYISILPFSGAPPRHAAPDTIDFHNLLFYSVFSWINLFKFFKKRKTL